jgi:hypothetical protein
MRRIAKFFKKRWNTYAFLREYFHAIGQEWQDLLWGPGVLAVLWGIWFLVGSPPTSVNWMAIVVALFLAGYYVWRAEHVRLLPGLEFGGARVVRTPTTNVITGEPGAERVVGQVLVKLRSPEAQVKNAAGQLLRVWKWSDKDSDWTRTEVDEPLDLLWSIMDQPVRTLSTDQQLCVFCVDEDRRCIRIWAQRNVLRMEKMFENSDPSDIFKFDISVRGENCPATWVSLKVQIGSQWDKPIFQRIAITEDKTNKAAQNASKGVDRD